jgi:PAT family beta-lactamase induction signal transducer AmpG
MGLSNATFGLVGGFIVLPLPQILAAEGLSEARIAAVSAACLSPGFWVFLLGPVLDIRFTRRFYASLFAVLAGLGVFIAVELRGHVLVFEAAVMTAYAAAVLSSNAIGGWFGAILPAISHTDRDDPSHEAARLSAWTQVGSFLGGGAMAVLPSELLRILPVHLAATILGVIVVLPAAVFPWVPLPSAVATRFTLRSAQESFSTLFRELKTLLTRREVLLAMLLFVAPTGAFALTNQLTGVARDFHASDAFVSRIGGAVLSCAGAAVCLLVPIFARWIKPLPLYLLIGSAGSLFTLALLLLPRTPATFALAFMIENVMQALSFTAAVAISFTTIGGGNPLAATQFSLLTSATVLPILYMGVLDGRTYTGLAGLHGLSGMYVIDGCISLASCAAMALLLRRVPLLVRLPPAEAAGIATMPR